MTSPNGHFARLRVWVRVADAVTVMLLALATLVALGDGFAFSFLGLRISARNVAPLLMEAAVVFALRHLLVRTPPLHERIRTGLAACAHRLVPAAVAFGLPGIVYCGVLVHGYDGGPYLRGDCADYYRTARSILEDGDIDISNQFAVPSAWEGVSLSIDHRLVPKHPILMPVVSIPFIAAFGPVGALVFNVAQLGCLLAVLYQLAKRWTSAWPAALAVALTGVATFLPHYVWNYSADVFASLVLAAALLPLTSPRPDGDVRRYLLGGVLTGLAVVAKQPLMLFVPTTFTFVGRSIGRSSCALAVGLLISLGAFGLYNARLFGSPFVTAYDRIAVRDGSGIGVFSQRASFTLPMSEGARGQLLDPKHGLLATSGVTLLSLAGLPALAVRRRAAAAHVAIGCLALFLLFSMYDQWNASHYGNRFLMPAVALCAIPLAALFEFARDGFRRRQRGLN